MIVDRFVQPALVIALVCSCHGATPEPFAGPQFERTHLPTPLPALGSTQRPTKWAAGRSGMAAGHTKIVYRVFWPGIDATLIGVDHQSKRAYLKLRKQDGDPRYLIDTIDYERGERIERWEAGRATATQLALFDAHFLPLSQNRRSDLRRLAKMVARSRGRFGRSGSLWPVNDASPDAGQVIFSAQPKHAHGGEGLFMLDRRRDAIVRIDRGVVASYDPKFSPDGQFIAWQGCTGKNPCQYRLYLTRTRDAIQRRKPWSFHQIQDPNGPVWRADGQALYVLTTPPHKTACVVSVALNAPERVVLRHCHRTLTGFSFDPSTEHMLVTEVYRTDRQATQTMQQGSMLRGSMQRGPMRPRTRLLRLPTRGGPTVAEQRIDGEGEATMSDAGLVIRDESDDTGGNVGKGGLIALDMNTGKRTPIRGDGFVFVPNIRWLDGRRALWLRKSFGSESIALEVVDVHQHLYTQHTAGKPRDESSGTIR